MRKLVVDSFNGADGDGGLKADIFDLISFLFSTFDSFEILLITTSSLTLVFIENISNIR